MGKSKKVPYRKCIGCQEMKPKRELIRIVRTPEATVELDFTGKRSGRGAYLCPNKECLDQSLKGGRLDKALRFNVPEDTITCIRKEIIKSERNTQTPGTGPKSPQCDLRG
ncbi:MAG: YlxR family protein [Peptococcaceae bacterium]|nr:YlxR family protein [Peptococcaceae bacterium]